MNPHPIIAQLHVLRLLSHRTLSDVALHSGVKRDTIHSWETGERQPSLGALAKYLAAMDCDLVLVDRS